MPTPEARAAFDAAQAIAAQMRDIHAQEVAIEEAKGNCSDAPTLLQLDRELVILRNDWSNLAKQYTESVGRFNQAVEQARRDLKYGKAL
jgi:hypothetical protein